MEPAAISRAAARSSLAISRPYQSSATASVLFKVKYPKIGLGLLSIGSTIARVTLTPLVRCPFAVSGR
jgi:hypothetical protein